MRWMRWTYHSVIVPAVAVQQPVIGAVSPYRVHLFASVQAQRPPPSPVAAVDWTTDASVSELHRFHCHCHYHYSAVQILVWMRVVPSVMQRHCYCHCHCLQRPRIVCLQFRVVSHCLWVAIASAAVVMLPASEAQPRQTDRQPIVQKPALSSLLRWQAALQRTASV